MKKIIAFLTLIAFSAATAVQAGETASSDKTKSSCCDNKAKVTAQARSGCSDSGSCCDSAKPAVTAVKSHQKGATQLVRLLSDSRAKS